jgi:hypothetical protein
LELAPAITKRPFLIASAFEPFPHSSPVPVEIFQSSTDDGLIFKALGKNEESEETRRGGKARYEHGSYAMIMAGFPVVCSRKTRRARLMSSAATCA